MGAVSPLTDDAVGGKMEVSEMSVARSQLHRNRLSDRAGSAACLGHCELEAFGEIDARTRFFARYRVSDRFASRVENAGHCQPGLPSINVNLKEDLFI